MPKPNFVRIASGNFLTEMVDTLACCVDTHVREAYEDWPWENIEKAILDLAKLLEDMYNTGVQVGIREAYERIDND